MEGSSLNLALIVTYHLLSVGEGHEGGARSTLTKKENHWE